MVLTWFLIPRPVLVGIRIKVYCTLSNVAEVVDENDVWVNATRVAIVRVITTMAD